LGQDLSESTSPRSEAPLPFFLPSPREQGKDVDGVVDCDDDDHGDLMMMIMVITMIIIIEQENDMMVSLIVMML
jgi:hypothetical protein